MSANNHWCNWLYGLWLRFWLYRFWALFRMKKGVNELDWRVLSYLYFLHSLNFWESIHVWERSKDSDKDIANATTMVNCAVIVNDTSCRSVLMCTFMIDKDFITTGDSIFDKIVGSGYDLGLDRNNFH